MGASQSSTATSTYSNEETIRGEMASYAAKWSHKGQTEHFRNTVPLEETDFTQTFKDSGLNEFFTSSKLRLGKGFNCNLLFRDSRKQTKIPILSTENHTVLQPLGEPGRDLGENCGTKVSHLMVINHSDLGPHDPVTFNEMLPSTAEELDDLEIRMGLLETAYENLSNNVPLTECGDKVLEKATEMGVDHQTGIRDFMVMQIMALTDKDLEELPGYKLLNEQNENITRNEEQVQMLVNDVFGEEKIPHISLICIQGPKNNSQVLSHLHQFKVPSCMMGNLPKVIRENYYDCKTILKIKREFIMVQVEQEREESGMLVRTKTVRAH